ncbi:MAG: hypothetical protein KDJ45_03625 [Hyphomicrobiaceae bacterium]|nr:hypothetical protein [Hyphomicrobiaceae bacterium]MCC0010734.1 hypothetical protein [Hyphomicrobiaceae bacterium]
MLALSDGARKSGCHSCTGGLLSALSGNPHVKKGGSVPVGSYPAAGRRWSVPHTFIDGVATPDPLQK